MKKSVILFGCVATILLMVSTVTALPATSIRQETVNVSITDVNNDVSSVQLIKSMPSSELFKAIKGEITATDSDILFAIQKIKSMSDSELLVISESMSDGNNLDYNPQALPLLPPWLLALIGSIIGLFLLILDRISPP